MKCCKSVFSGLLALALFLSVICVLLPARAAFTDVPEGVWYAEALDWCREHGIVNDGSEFFPQSVMTRAMVATALYRASGSPTVSAPSKFADATNDAAIAWAAETGVVTGYDDNTFRPGNPVTRQQFAAMLWRSAGSPAADAGADYVDEASISAYAKTAVDWARDAGVILGKDGNLFDPHGGATRAQAAVILYRYLKEKRNIVSEDAPLLLAINGTPIEVKWENNDSVNALRELAAKNPITIQMSPYGGFEQVGSLSENLPREDARTATDAGDIALYQGNSIVIFYGSNSWAYTRLGHIENLSRQELQNLLGGKGVTAVLSVKGADNLDSGVSNVYMTTDISPEGLLKAYQALNWKPTGKVAVKLSTGEPPNSNYLRPELIKDLVQSVNGTIIECNTAYGGSRASSAMHKQVAADHGFTTIANFDLMDEDGEKELPLTEGVRLNRAIVGSHIDRYNSFLILSHFKGHAMAGFGGAIKNVAIGMSSASGKVYVHTAGTKTSGSIFYSDQDAWLEALPEMVKAVREYAGVENIVYVNVMNRLSVDCDCDGNPTEPDMHDIGILSSTDPVALDQACVDLVYAAPDGASLISRMERQHGVHALEHGEKIGLGNRNYHLISID